MSFFNVIVPPLNGPLLYEMPEDLSAEARVGQRVLVPLKKKLKPQGVFALYTAGCRVKHPSWGIGIVRDCYGDGDDQKVIINFPNIGVKRLAVRFANLEKI